MLEKGGRGETKRQIQQILRPNSSFTQFDDQNQQVNFQNKFRGVILQSANAVFVESQFSLSPDYKNIIESQFQGRVSEMSFKQNPSEALNDINQFVEDETKGEIADLLPQDAINSDTRVVLVNALYFKGVWKTVFQKEATEIGEFRVSERETRDVPMMYTFGAFNHGQLSSDAGVSYIEIPYKRGEMSMFILVPKPFSEMSQNENEERGQFGSLAAVIESLQQNPNFIQSLQPCTSNKTVHLYLPKFTLEFSTRLSDVLMDLGVEDAFIPGVADFGEMVQYEQNKELYLSEGFHKAKIVVNEQGTKAAAATGLVMLRRSAGIIEQVFFVVDQPFVFFLMHKPSNVIYFAGQVIDPSLESQ